MNVIRVSVCLLLAVPAYGDATKILDYRDWTSSDGKVLEARLLAVDARKYKLKSKKDGRTYEIPVERISDGDKKLVADAGAELDEIKEKCRRSDGEFGGFSDPSEKFWQLAEVLGRGVEFGQLICGSYSSTTSALSLTANGYRRESNKSFLIEGDHIMARITVTDPNDSLVESGEKLHLQRKTKVRSTKYSYYGSYYDTKLSILRVTLSEKGALFQPQVGMNTPLKIVSCARERVGVGEYLVFTLRADFSGS
jgi:hypothetical protein